MALPVNIIINYTIDGGITAAANGGDILHVYMNEIELSTDNGLVNNPLPNGKGKCFG